MRNVNSITEAEDTLETAEIEVDPDLAQTLWKKLRRRGNAPHQEFKGANYDFVSVGDCVEELEEVPHIYIMVTGASPALLHFTLAKHQTEPGTSKLVLRQDYENRPLSPIEAETLLLDLKGAQPKLKEELQTVERVRDFLVRATSKEPAAPGHEKFLA